MKFHLKQVGHELDSLADVDILRIGKNKMGLTCEVEEKPNSMAMVQEEKQNRRLNKP